MAKTIEHYRELLPLALEWVREIEQHCLDNGRVLTEKETQDAISVGVAKPENMRLLMVERLIQPEHPALLQAAAEIGLPFESACARAMGYGVEVLDGYDTRRLLRHEFRHVYQFEQAGSLELFINAYIESLLTHGYHDSSFEQDARAHEVPQRS